MLKSLKPSLHKTFVATAFLAILTSTAIAQDANNQYDPDYRPDFIDDIVKDGDEVYTTSDVLNNQIYHLAFTRPEGLNHNEVSLTLMTSGTASGCLDVTPPKVKEIKYTGTSARVEIESLRINPDNSERHYTLNGCKKKSANIKLDIILDKNRLIEDNIKKIMIVPKGGGVMNLKIDINHERAVFIVPIEVVLAAGGDPTNGKNIYIHWFYPENTVILYNPSLELDKETRQKLVQFAKGRGMVPLTNTLPDFRTKQHNKDMMYFIDLDGVHSAPLRSNDDVIALGNIKKSEIHQGAEGPVEKIVKKTIFMKRPGLYE